MDRKLLRRVLELLYVEYPRSFSVGRFMESLGHDSKSEFNKIIRYLRASHKIIATEELKLSDEISLKPEGIDFLESLKLEDSREKIAQRQTRLIEVTCYATIILSLIAILQALLLPGTAEWRNAINFSGMFSAILFLIIYIFIISFIVMAMWRIFQFITHPLKWQEHQ